MGEEIAIHASVREIPGSPDSCEPRESRSAVAIPSQVSLGHNYFPIVKDYKADFHPTSEWATVAVPFADFSDDWSRRGDYLSHRA